MELYRMYRPTKLSQIIGQKEAVKTLTEMIRRNSVPHALLFSGSSGCGKTTAARIMKSRVGCSGRDLLEINAAEARGIGTVREIQQRMTLSPLEGKVRVYILDEVHHFSRREGGDAQTALLKVLEECPKHVHFFLCSTDPQQLRPTLRGRCQEVRFGPLNRKELREVLFYVAQKAKIQITEEAADKIAEVCVEGGARKAIQILDQVAGIEDEQERLDAIENTDSKRNAIELARSMMNPRSQWKDLANLLNKLEEDPETLRRMVLAYSTEVLLQGGKLAERAYDIIQIWRDAFFEGGRAALVASCWTVFSQRKQ